MPYYNAGDYYQGDYYRGDFLGIGKALKRVAGVATGVVSKLGIPGVSGVAGLAHGLLAGGTVQPRVLPAPLRLHDPGSATMVPTFTLGGGSGRRRRINPLNIKALRRAMRRAKGFEKQARRVGSFFNPGKTYRLKGRKRRKCA